MNLPTELALLRAYASPAVEAGVVAQIVECRPDWCRLGADGLRGWVRREALWGLQPDEVLD